MRRAASTLDTYLKPVANKKVLSRNAVDRKMSRVCLIYHLLTDLAHYVVWLHATPLVCRAKFWLKFDFTLYPQTSTDGFCKKTRTLIDTVDVDRKSSTITIRNSRSLTQTARSVASEIGGFLDFLT